MNFDLDLSTPILARTPGVLNALLDGLPASWTRGVEGPDTFSPFDVVGHLIDGEETDWVPRARIILARGPDPVFEPYDRFRHRARNVGRTLGSLLEEFAQLREENLVELRSWDLTSAALDLPGIHPSLGPVHPPAAPGILGRPRPGAPRPGRSGDGQATPPGGRTLGALPAGAHRP